MISTLVAGLMRLVIEAIGGVSSFEELEKTKLDVNMEPNLILYPRIFKDPTDLLHKIRAAPIGRYHECQLNNKLQLVDSTYTIKYVCTSWASQDSVKK